MDRRRTSRVEPKKIAIWLPAVAIAATIFALSSQPRVPTVGFSAELLPIAGHLIAYGSLAITLMVALERTGFSVPRAARLAFASATLYGFSDEFHQTFVPGRHADPFDLLVNAIGAGLAVLLLVWFRKRRAIAHRARV